MFASRPKTIVSISALLLVLALLSLVSLLMSPMLLGGTGSRGTMPGPPPDGEMPANGGNFRPGGNNPQGGDGNFQPGEGNGDFRQAGRNRPAGAFAIFRTLGPAMRYISIGYPAAGILLALVSAWGVWKQKRWGLNLAMVLAILFLLGSLPGLFMGGGRMFNAWPMVQNTIKGLSSVAILFMGILPSVRDSVS